MCQENCTICINLKQKICVKIYIYIRFTFFHYIFILSNKPDFLRVKLLAVNSGMRKLIGSKYPLSSFAVFEFQGRGRPTSSACRTSFECYAKQTGDCRKVSSQIGFLTWQKLPFGDPRTCPFRFVGLARAREKERIR